MTAHLLAITIAYVLDYIWGDPKGRAHPVVWMGSMIALITSKCNKGRFRKGKGMIMTISVVVTVFAVAYAAVLFSYRWSTLAGVMVEGMLIWTTIAEKGLRQAANAVYEPLSNNQMEQARTKLSEIVGRDTHYLNEEGIVRGAVETVAENISDGVTAPLLFAFLGGAPLAAAYRAVNTCDSMVGYRQEPFTQFGWASARLDDIVNVIPSRLTAIVMIFVSSSVYCSKMEVLRNLPKEAVQHPSPNSGWGEAAAALLLGVQLGGVNYYFGEKSNRPTIGIPRTKLKASHIPSMNTLLQRTVFCWIILLWIGGGIRALAISWS